MTSLVQSLVLWVAVMTALTLTLSIATFLLRGRYRGAALSTSWTLIAVAWLFPFRPEILAIPGRALPASEARALQGTALDSASMTASTSTEWLLPLLIGLWATGTVIALGILVVQHLRLRRHVRQAGTLPASADLLTQIERESDRLNLSYRPSVVLICGLDSPAVVGIIRPRLLLPADPRFHSRFVLRHELAHIRRHDTLTRLALNVVVALQWWNPLLRLAAKNSAEAAEIACDQTALADANTEQRCDYAQLLVTASASHGVRPLTSVALLPGSRALANRVSSALGTRGRRVGRETVIATVVLLAGLGVPVAWGDSSPSSETTLDTVFDASDTDTTESTRHSEVPDLSNLTEETADEGANPDRESTGTLESNTVPAEEGTTEPESHDGTSSESNGWQHKHRVGASGTHGSH
ncbi:M56 family metallopeptidase [Actinomycetaceae bacterium MB13-C1-2]|nr:M56 family metallopeptidase [Actinomycetaceae bacterium MB13-C1-2]